MAKRSQQLRLERNVLRALANLEDYFSELSDGSFGPYKALYEEALEGAYETVRDEDINLSTMPLLPPNEEGDSFNEALTFFHKHLFEGHFWERWKFVGCLDSLTHHLAWHFFANEVNQLSLDDFLEEDDSE